MSTASIAEHHTHDHARLDELLQQYQSLKTSDRVQAANNFREFKAGREQHIVWEEQILFPPFETKFRLPGGPTKVIRWEHRKSGNTGTPARIGWRATNSTQPAKNSVCWRCCVRTARRKRASSIR